MEKSRFNQLLESTLGDVRPLISEVGKPQPVNPSKYTGIDFKQIGHGNPLGDKINPFLLDDVNLAAEIAGVKASVTTAVTGHKPGTRHEPGLAVDLAVFDGQGYSSEQDAKNKGIYDGIKRFVDALKDMGYKINSERGNEKAVLWFGFPNHQHHVHVSRTTFGGDEKLAPLNQKEIPTKNLPNKLADLDVKTLGYNKLETNIPDTLDPLKKKK
jgi:hypothetical protein